MTKWKEPDWKATYCMNPIMWPSGKAKTGDS